ncbi:hypothetical protein GCM10025865_01280 [Paraoerskovia sediminicola]|uniref:Siphovirus-type tail component C-terminal domain-containing protein n=1 Tax=Paraoerskovia sediminicola TaxID=1138587 RepID=A0ABN6X7X5_9CELL|nr:hypothetical protein [Paraoerskovia sediminicola]BDZ40829.1 hypothetical protein GCM10025865_01280 [Paraoerskovia sediminicola]
MTYVVYVQPPPAPTYVPPHDARNFWLETADGTIQTPIGLDVDGIPVLAQRGMLGLGVNPSEPTMSGTPGADGAAVTGVTYGTRPVALPLLFVAPDDKQATLWAAVQKVRDITDPARGMARDGNFRLVCSSPSGVRQITLVYRSGLEGDDQEMFGVDRAVLDCLAPDPFARDRDERTLTFPLGTVEPFLSDAPGTDLPWPRALAPTTVIGDDMRVDMTSAVPVYPTIEVTGPVDSVLITSDTGLRIDVPGGVPSGQTLRIVTDPRGKSIRLDGALAAGMLARGSRFEPFTAGENRLDVAAPGATSDTLLAITWRGGHRGLW